ncbi:MAG: tyrosine-type recombinase/integrase [Thermoguttaceae bacterium]|nr:tyrosine-type recombinase/integrase [Thermoguttaceae bacterium]
MASVSKRKNGKYTVIFYWNKPYPIKIYLSTKNRREAERAADNIQSLVDSARNGTVNAENDYWLAKLREGDVELHSKLVKLGLAKNLDSPKTLKELVDLFILQNDKKPSTVKAYAQVATVLYQIFGESRKVDSISTEDASRFLSDLKTIPLNQRSKTPQVYSQATISKTVVKTKSFFNFAEQIGWVEKSPFRFLKSGSQVNQEKWQYVPRETVSGILGKMKNPKWKAILALGRFAGCRGSSEMFNLTWDMIDFENQTLTFYAIKKEAYSDVRRTVPMNKLLCLILRELKHSQESNPTKHLFPGMRYNDNIGTMTEKYIIQAELTPWPEPWYNLRRSFCSDVMEAGVDPKVYEEICGHRFETGMKHYQILHPDRKRKGIDRVREVMDN